MSWPMVRLSQVCSVLSGFAFKSDYFGDSGIPLVRIRDVMRGFSETYYSGEYDEQFIVNNNDILIGMDGDFNIAKWVGGEALLNQRVCKITPVPSIVDADYLYYFLPLKLKEIWDETAFVTVKHLSVKKINDIEIPLPKLSIQKEISAMLRASDSLRNQSKKMESELNALARAVFLEMFGDPVCNTKRWPTKTLSQVVSISSGGTPSKSNDSYWQGDFPWVSPKDMKIDYLSDAKDHISDLVFEETNIKKIPEGTILVVVRGMILAHSIPLAMNLCDIAINQDIKALTVCNDGIETEFLFHCLKNLKDHILSKVSTAAHGTKRLDTPDLLGLEIIIPPLDLQYKYVEIMRKNARMLECYKQSSLTNKQLFDSLMQRAFSGKLDLKKVA
ncbi:restriction endonuclease subunit S [Cronobacter dublinensis]|uniref:restriction endonuclease subunit S n=1 Tax=Cronobacter dublinensis TaxID=413497 RepID=UPI0018F86BA8|nr:restriction endonuclease subunit S [Cronobacter dublinensis]